MSDFDFTELVQLDVSLGKAGSKAEALAKKVIKKTAFDVVAGAQALAPVDTGNLKSSIGADTDADGLGFGAGPTANYGYYVEYGTSRMGPQPYMRPAFDRAIEPLPEVLAQIGEKSLE